MLVVNDGSKDGTLQVARDYAERYPGIVVAVDQENRNWGGAVNHALELASGTFFYIVDSDDWLDSAKLTEVVSRLRMLEEQQAGVGYMVNYVYNPRRKRRPTYYFVRSSFRAIRSLAGMR